MRALYLLPLTLAACQQPAAEGNTAGENTAAATAPAGFSPTQLRVIELPEAQQQGVFLRAIRDGDAPCQGVAESNRQADQNGNPVFVARCTDGPVYALAIDATGTAQVTRVSPDRR